MLYKDFSAEMFTISFKSNILSKTVQDQHFPYFFFLKHNNIISGNIYEHILSCKNITYPNNDLSSSVTTIKNPVFCYHDDFTIFNMSLCVLFALVHNFMVILLSNTKELTIVNNCPHHTFMVHLL